MIKSNISRSKFKIQILTQTDNHNLWENVAICKKYILRKMGLNFQNSEFNILSKIAFCNK